MATPIGQMTGRVRALFSDVDGTLTSSGRLEASTYAALEQLDNAGIAVVLVTGRPAGWGQALMALAPVAAVVTENGGVTFANRPGIPHRTYGVSEASLPEWRRRMRAAVDTVQRQVPGATLSSDSTYREVDLAIDWNETASLSQADADRVVTILRGEGFRAVRSSVHVNFGPPCFDKLSASREVIRRVFDGDPSDLTPYVFVGDALNDEPMFGGFPRSIGVANVHRYWDQLGARPRFVTSAPEGRGVREVVTHLLALQRQHSTT